MEFWKSSKFVNFKSQLETVAAQQKCSKMENLKRQDQVVFDTWNSLLDSDIRLKIYTLELQSIFESTYFCEQTFSNVKFIKYELINQH